MVELLTTQALLSVKETPCFPQKTSIFPSHTFFATVEDRMHTAPAFVVPLMLLQESLCINPHLCLPKSHPHPCPIPSL